MQSQLSLQAQASLPCATLKELDNGLPDREMFHMPRTLMKTAEIQDWQFGRLRWDGKGQYEGEVEWAPGLMIELWLRTNSAALSATIEHIRSKFNSLKALETEYLSFATRDLADQYNNVLMDDDKDKTVDVRAFIDRMTLIGVIIDPAGESTLTYSTWGMPLVVVTVAPDLSFKNALLD